MYKCRWADEDTTYSFWSRGHGANALSLGRWPLSAVGTASQDHWGLTADPSSRYVPGAAGCGDLFIGDQKAPSWYISTSVFDGFFLILETEGYI